MAITLQERIAELVKHHGSLRNTARVIGVDVGYLSRMASGERAAPRAPVLRRIGLRRVVCYERIKP